MKNTMDKILLAFIYWSHYRDSLSILQYGQVVDGNDGNGTVPVLVPVRYRTVNKLWWKNKTTVLVLVPYCYSIVPVTVFKHDFLFFYSSKKKYIEI